MNVELVSKRHSHGSRTNTAVPPASRAICSLAMLRARQKQLSLQDPPGSLYVYIHRAYLFRDTKIRELCPTVQRQKDISSFHILWNQATNYIKVKILHLHIKISPRAVGECMDPRISLRYRYKHASFDFQSVLSSPGAASYCCASSPGQAPSTRCILVPLPLTTLLRTPRECRSRSLRRRSPSPTTPRCPTETVQTRHADRDRLGPVESNVAHARNLIPAVVSRAGCYRLFQYDILRMYLKAVVDNKLG